MAPSKTTKKTTTKSKKESTASKTATKKAASKTTSKKSGSKAKNGAAKKEEPVQADANRDKLIALGKSKGYVTYDDVNEHMPDNITSSDQIDSWLSGQRGQVSHW